MARKGDGRFLVEMGAIRLVAVVAGVLHVAGCDTLFGLSNVESSADAPVDNLGDTASDVGCRDGFREAFLDGTEPLIAGCGGAWGVAGLEILTPSACRGGNHDVEDGVSCHAADLCSDGWHLCSSRGDVQNHLAGLINCAAGITSVTPTFFATRQSTQTAGMCITDVMYKNDIIGCGNLTSSEPTGCAPLNDTSGDGCMDLVVTGGAWSCGGNGITEVALVTKTAKTGGGVLCCKDP